MPPHDVARDRYSMVLKCKPDRCAISFEESSLILNPCFDGTLIFAKSRYAYGGIRFSFDSIFITNHYLSAFQTVNIVYCCLKCLLVPRCITLAFPCPTEREMVLAFMVDNEPFIGSGFADDGQIHIVGGSSDVSNLHVGLLQNTSFTIGSDGLGIHRSLSPHSGQ